MSEKEAIRAYWRALYERNRTKKLDWCKKKWKRLSQKRKQDVRRISENGVVKFGPFKVLSPYCIPAKGSSRPPKQNVHDRYMRNLEKIRMQYQEKKASTRWKESSGSAIRLKVWSLFH